MSKKIFIIAGEVSGDIHASKLVLELKSKSPDIEIYCWGGTNMKSAGAIVLKDISELAFMGFVEVVKNLFTILSNFRQIKAHISKIKPNMVILVDFPGFNLRLSHWLKAQNITTYYYIAPQLWAWKENRIKILKKNIQKLFVILPFEQEYFRSRGVEAAYIGSPIMEDIKGINSKKSKKIALLPGSRKQEIQHILPLMLEIVELYPDYQFEIAGVENVGMDFYQRFLKNNRATIVFDNANEVISSSQIALVSSGTATLQTALLGTYQIVCYRTGSINYALAKHFIKVKYISLVNLILGRPAITELIQEDLNANNLQKNIDTMIDSDFKNISNEYAELKTLIGDKSPSKILTKEILIELGLSS